MGLDLRAPVRAALKCCTASWSDYSRLFTVEDRGNWVIHWEMQELRNTAKRLGTRLADPFWIPFSKQQAVFYGSQFFLLADDWIKRPHRIATAYFHGLPGTGHDEFDELYAQIRRHHDHLDRVQVSHSEMETVLLEAGLAREKVHRIPIGIHADLFRPQTPEKRSAARKALGIHPDAFVVGSFQKDGQGWGEGMEPKLIKGPDVFASVMRNLKDQVPKLTVLLSGPARGYIQKELAEAGIPVVHKNLDDYREVAGLYESLDAYLVSSRQEGGPKAVLESMASGVPLITTRVGQAMDLVRDGENGWMCEVEDVEGLTDRLLAVFRESEPMAEVLSEGRKTAERWDYPQLDPLWKRFFADFVETTA